MYRLALLSMHGCPVSRLGERDTGGMNVYILQIAKELGRRGHIVDVYTRLHDIRDPQVQELGDNARVIHLEAGPVNESKGGLLQYIPQFVDNLYSFQSQQKLTYDLIHSHYWLSGEAGTNLRRDWNIPHVTTFHTLGRVKMEARPAEKESDDRLKTESHVVKQADSVIVSTMQEKLDLERLYGLPFSKVAVVPAGVDLDLFKPTGRSHAKRELDLGNDLILLSVGRIEPIKGLDLLISALAETENIANTKLVIVGGEQTETDEKNRLETLALRLGLQQTIKFVSAVNQLELPTYYNAADVFVMPSFYESFGLAALESMACGTPVIASRVAGPKSFIDDEKTGMLVSWQSPKAYAERIDQLLNDLDLRMRIAASASQKARSMGWNMVADKILEHYNHIVGQQWTKVVGED